MPQLLDYLINGAPGEDGDDGAPGADGADGLLVPGGRLSLATGDPLPTTDQTAKTTVYYTPYVHSFINLYTGSDWSRILIGSSGEKSVAVPSTTVTPFDVFGYLSAGDLALETVSWTNDTTRATGLTRQDGFLVKSGDVTRLYLGTGRTTSVSGQCEDSLTKRFLMNQYNRKERVLTKSLSGSGYTYSTNTVRQTNADAANKVEMVCGRADCWLYVQSTQYLISSAAETASAAGVQLDDTTTRGGLAVQFSLGLAGAGVLVGSAIRAYATLGYHAAYAVENGAGTGTQTWFPAGADRGLYGAVVM